MPPSRPPPSFNSFPEALPLRTQTITTSRLTSESSAPPSTLSTTSTPSKGPELSDGRPYKRARASDFLDNIGEELKLPKERNAEIELSSSVKGLQYLVDQRETTDAPYERSHRSHKEKHKSSKPRNHRIRESGSDVTHREHDKGKDGKKREKGRTSAVEKGHRKASPIGTHGTPYQLVQTPAEEQIVRKPRLPAYQAPSPKSELANSDERIYYSSRKGDNFNIRYGGLHRGDVPKYYRTGSGRVLGLNDGLRITKESAYTNRGLEVGPQKKYITPRYIDPRSMQHLNNKHYKRVSLQVERHKEDQPLLTEQVRTGSLSSVPSDYICLVSEISQQETLDKLENEEGQIYRSIAGMIKASDLDGGNDNESDDEYNGLGIEGGVSQLEYLRDKTIEFDRALREHPEDVQKWLDFIEFQDEVALSSFAGSCSGQLDKRRAFSSVEKASLSEIKISILDRALSATDSNSTSEKLLLAYLRSASDLWEPKKVLLKWKETLENNPALTGLWIEYVGWRQTSWTNFTIKDVVETYEDSFKVLTKAIESPAVDEDTKYTLEGTAIYLFLRCCLMLRQAGYSERALAAFQALIEINFFQPPQLERIASITDLLPRFEVFWDSESPRIGEDNGLGWKNMVDAVAPEPIKVPALANITNENVNERWALLEQEGSRSRNTPARTLDEIDGNDDDPFRVVFFDEIRNLMFLVRSKDARMQLVYAFLTFVGLSFTPPDISTTTPFSTDMFIHSELVEKKDLLNCFWPKEDGKADQNSFEVISGEPMYSARRAALESPFLIPFNTTPFQTELLFPTRAQWFLKICKNDLEGADVGLIRNFFTNMTTCCQDTSFSLYFLAFEACQKTANAAKLAKQMLRHERNNIAIWDGYARILRQDAKIEDARKVYSTACSTPHPELPLIRRAWSEMEWENGQSDSAMKILVNAYSRSGPINFRGTQSEVSPHNQSTSSSEIQIMKAKQTLQTMLDWTNHEDGMRRHLAASFALMTYLTSGLESAMSVLEGFLLSLDAAGMAGSSEHEELYIFYAKLLYRDRELRAPETGKNKSAGYKPSRLRDVLERAIRLFPHNSLFLSLFYYNELKMKIQNRVRRTLETSILGDDIVTSQSWLFAVYAECHLSGRSVNVWAVRNTFDRAVAHTKTKASASIWVLYIDLEIKFGDLAKAKSLTYRAIRECPWVKELYLKPFLPPLNVVFTSSEVQSIYSLLLEKGLRIRSDLDISHDRTIDEESEEEHTETPLVNVRDVEEIYSERARLMPY